MSSSIDKAVSEPHKAWGREEADRHSFPERDNHDIRLVFRDVLQWDDLVEQTEILSLAIDLLRPLADAYLNGVDEARQVVQPDA